MGLALIAGFGFSAIASADEPLDDRFYVAPLASYSFFDEDNFDPDDQVGAQLSLGKTLTKHLALELYAFHFNDVDTDRIAGVNNLDSTGYGISALLFPARDIFPIFGIIGIGEGQHDFDGPATTGGSPLNDQDSDFIDVGIGFLAPINDFGIAVRGEYRYRTSDVDAPGGGEFKFRDNVVSLGLQIPLGAKPQAAAPAPSPKPAPKPAPAQPVDSDGDGVPDNRDQCPGTPAGVRVNAVGCPIEKKAPVVLKGVTFEFNSAKLTSQAGNRLDNVVNALKGSPKINVRVEGHTDSIGGAAYNQKLSQQRADSVKAYLTSHGIAASRLMTKGFGETRPVAPNTKPNGADNPAGRAQNRRVELHVVK